MDEEFYETLEKVMGHYQAAVEWLDYLLHTEHVSSPSWRTWVELRKTEAQSAKRHIQVIVDELRREEQS